SPRPWVGPLLASDNRRMRLADLHALAVQSMQARGLLPAFSPTALHGARGAAQSPPEQAGEIRDLRHLPWFSIDNDDTRDLDQLSVIDPAGGSGGRGLGGMGEGGGRG